MSRRVFILGVLCSLICSTPNVVHGSSIVHTGLDISSQCSMQVQELQLRVSSLQRELQGTKSKLQRAQEKSFKQEIYLKDIEKKYKNLESDYNKLSSDIFYDSFIVKEGDISEQLVSLVESELDYVDISLLKKLQSNGWSIVLTDRNVASEYYKDTSLGSLAGLTWYDKNNKRVCYISARESAIKSATLHEIGHAIQYENGNLLANSDSTFKGIWSTEKGILRDNEPEVRDYDVHSPDEYFAEYFFRWCHNKDLQEQCKGTYTYLSSYVDAIMQDTNIEAS